MQRVKRAFVSFFDVVTMKRIGGLGTFKPDSFSLECSGIAR